MHDIYTLTSSKKKEELFNFFKKLGYVIKLIHNDDYFAKYNLK